MIKEYWVDFVVDFVMGNVAFCDATMVPSGNKMLKGNSLNILPESGLRGVLASMLCGLARLEGLDV